MATKKDAPAYQVLATELRDAIVAGRFPPGSPLPPEIELSEQRNLSRQTVRQAFAELVTDGLVYRVRGRGTFVTPFSQRGSHLQFQGSIPSLLAWTAGSELEVLSPLERGVEAEAAARLGLTGHEIMRCVVRRRHAGEPFVLTTVHVSVEIGQALLDGGYLGVAGQLQTETVITAVEDVLNAPLGGAEQVITAVSLPADIAPLIDAEPGGPGLRMDRLYFDREARPIELSISHANPARYAYRLELNRTRF